jgi:hypothetical protein
MKLKLFLLSVLGTAGLLLPLNTFAVGPLSVKLGQPKSPTNQDNLKLTFVALEIGGTSNIAVGCYKKSPTDSDYVKFEDLTLIPGGNTAYCNVTGSIINTNGTYNFLVKANGVDSNIVSVDFNTSGPSTPNSYSKERLNDCDYKIKFRTANDGRTVKVQLFRSDTYSISVSGSSVLTQQNIGPDLAGEFTNSVPVCGKEYYYVLRAVDNYGNASGTTGDSFTKTTTSTTTTTSTAQQALAVGTGSQVAGGVSDTELTVNPTTEVPSADANTPEVLGTETSKINYAKWISLVLIGLAIFFFLNSRKRA